MNNVLIINSPLYRYKDIQSIEDYLPPIGLGYIATNLEKNNFKVHFHDAVVENSTIPELLQLINDIKPNFICINIFTSNYEIVKEFVEAIPDQKINIIIGGLSIKYLHKKIIDWNTYNHIDMIMGDGEYICSAIIKNEVIEEPSYKNNKRRVYKIKEDSLYYAKDISKCNLDRKYFNYEPRKNVRGELEVSIITSRGCINNCAYCISARKINSDYPVREKSNNDIIKEIKEINELFLNVESIRILDDLFLKNKHSVEKAIKIFSEFDLKWRSMAHVQTFNGIKDELIKKMLKSGCSELFIGIDSGSPKILKMIHKVSNINLIKENIVSLLRIGISIKGYFIFGFPEENEDDIILTYQLAEFLKEQSYNYNSSFRTSVFQFRPYHGTELYKYLERKGNGNIDSVKPNNELSKFVGNSQYNLHSGNYSNVDDVMIYNYIKKTKSLNN